MAGDGGERQKDLGTRQPRVVRVLLAVAGSMLIGASIVALLVGSTGHVTVVTTSSPVSAPTTEATVHARFACGSVLNRRRYGQGGAIAVLGDGTFFESRATILNDSCDERHVIAASRAAIAAFGGLVIVVAAVAWPRRRLVRRLLVGVGAACGLAAILVPINGTLRWW